MPRVFFNQECNNLINNCRIELKDIQLIIRNIKASSTQRPYLTRYSLIRVHGTIEQCYKNIVAVYCENGSNNQMKNFLGKNFRSRALSLYYDRLLNNMKDFDEMWRDEFRVKFKRYSPLSKNKIKTSLTSLVDARNEFAHGINTPITFRDVKNYFKEAEKIISIIDRIIR